jgi:hypothetical protein
MKKYLLVFITILFIILAAGCGSDSNDNKQGNSNISADSSNEGYSNGSLDSEVIRATPTEISTPIIEETPEYEEKEPDVEESTGSSETDDDILWVSTIVSDLTPIATTLDDMALAARDIRDGIGSTVSFSLYAGDLDRETKEALSNSKKYTVSSELKEAQSEYNEAMIDLNKVAELNIKAVDAYNQGDTIKFLSLMSQSDQYSDSGAEHLNKTISLLN